MAVLEVHLFSTGANFAKRTTWLSQPVYKNWNKRVGVAR